MSLPSFRQEQDKELKMYREIYSRHKDFLSACVGHEFELVLKYALTSFIGSVKL